MDGLRCGIGVPRWSCQAFNDGDYCGAGSRSRRRASVRYDSLCDPLRLIGKERVRRHPKQGIEADDQRSSLPARGHGPEIDAEILCTVRLRAVEGVAQWERQGDVGEGE